MSRLKIAHLSDPHFGTILPGVEEGLLATLADLKPDLVLVTGDITQRARRSQFRLARAFIDKLKPTPVIAVPGNHDIPLFNLPARVFNPYGGFQKTFVDQLEKDFTYGDVLITGLNSTNRWRHVQGDFDLRRLETRIQQGARRAKIHIAAFHHPMDCFNPKDEKNLLVKREQTMAVFDRHRVDLMVGGHIHDPYVTLSSVRYPQTRRTMVIGVAGTCLSWRTRAGAPNSFNFIEADTYAVPKLTITRMDQGPDKRYAPLRAHAFERPDERGWQVIS